ncbi:LysE/ArgO family amino acid transporter [Paenibacillus segetis]|uniref:LysE/ArgO family amino acid transporter n=1 Tax=Paenibacillus segetis TaxID=1325360 RepID=UPI00166A7398|nr:LysE/ArgO family amino acid transporter [Paenibacillus segetis]
MLTALFHGIALALGLILPLGAQNVFVFNQGASQPNFKKAIPVIVTASLCDTFLILLAILGVSVIVFAIPALQTALFSIGLLFLLYMGWSIWRSKPSKLEQDATPLSSKKQILFALSVSLLNPHAIMDTIGVIGTSSLNYAGIDKVIFACATILVSWLWFSSIAFAGKLVGQIDTNGKIMLIINKISAIIIWIVAAYIAYKLFQM